MNKSGSRIIQASNPPSDREIGEWIGEEAYEYWKRVTHLIELNYPSSVTPEWLFGGKKHGWSLRYKKSRSFCTFIPERNRFALLIVFGAEERTQAEAILDSLSTRTKKVYDEATTYHDGKWVLLTINSSEVVEDVMKLLEIKRKPKKRNGA